MRAEDDDRALCEAARQANLPTLLAVLVQLTGERRWLEPPYRPSRTHGISDNDAGGLPDDAAGAVRRAACDAIRSWRAGSPIAWPSPSRRQLLTILATAMGEPIPDEYGLLLETEMRAEATPQRLTAPEGFNVVIIGAGIAGLCAGHRLQQAGIPFTIIERNESVGGVWSENRYPGAGVDTPAHLYSLSFARRNWRHYFATRDEVFEYAESVATDFGVRPHIRLGTEVPRAVYQQNGTWLVDVCSDDGKHEQLRASVVISAVGIFRPPIVPSLPGLDRFVGPSFHSARWPRDLDLTGKHVAMVGAGASAMQIGPAIVDAVASLTIFQRSQQWVMPFERFHEPVPEAVRWLMDEVPLYASWYRARLGWIFNDRIHSALTIDPTWEHADRSINAVNDRQRQMMTAYIESELGDRADLVEKVVPDYPPFGKRILLDNGWYQMLRKPHVTLVAQPVVEVRERGVAGEDGVEHPADVLVLATGFDVRNFVSTVDVVGQADSNLRDLWRDNGRAYLGMAVPGFPNFFCLYGPNLQPGHGGSVIISIERQVHYIVLLLKAMFERGSDSVEVDQRVHDSYNDEAERALNKMVWAHPRVNNYYTNSPGRNVVNSPHRQAEWFVLTEAVEVVDYRFRSVSRDSADA